MAYKCINCGYISDSTDFVCTKAPRTCGFRAGRWRYTDETPDVQKRSDRYENGQDVMIGVIFGPVALLASYGLFNMKPPLTGGAIFALVLAAGLIWKAIEAFRD